MRPDDFWIEQAMDSPWGPSTSVEVLNENLLRQLRLAPSSDHPDIEVAVALARFVHDEYEKFGTDSSQRLTGAQSREVLRTLRSVVMRLGITDFDPPYSDFGTFKTFWNRNQGHGSWQARQDMLNDAFDGLHNKLADLETRSLTSTLARPITPHERTGWPRVDAEIAELRRHFQNAHTDQDYRNVGNDCVIIIEALSTTVYDVTKHLSVGEEEPPVANTKQRLDRYVEVALPGSDSAPLRKMAKASIELAQAVKHRSAPSRRDAGIAADAVIQLANLLRRIADE